MTDKRPNLVLIGGGTGSFTLLRELKTFPFNITAVVNMCDDGGSTGVLRDELGVLPPGDIRQCLVALSNDENAAKIFNYRFAKGSLAGQSLGNLIMASLELQHNSFDEAVAVASKLLDITGNVIPVTLDNHRIVLRDGDTDIHGEKNIDNHDIKSHDALIRPEPVPVLNPAATAAIAEADLIVIAPGNIYSSILSMLSIPEFARAIGASRAQVVSIANLATKPGQTDNWHVADYVKEYERYLGEGTIDVVLYNDRPISQRLLKKYAAAGEYPVAMTTDRFEEVHARAVGCALISRDISVQDPGDTAIRRTLIRHDGKRVGQELIKVLEESTTL